MANKFTETTETGYGANIMNSIKGILFGVLLFLGSFVVLWTNEGRQDMSEAAKLCEPINETQIQTDMNGEPVSVSAKMTTEELLGDPGFIKPGKYLTLSRKVEMYAWVEKTSSTSKKKVGGKTVTETTYSYEKSWTSSPGNSANFKISEGHENPGMTIEGESFRVNTAKVGVYDVNLSSLSLPGSDALALTPEIVDFIPVNTEEAVEDESEYFDRVRGRFSTLDDETKEAAKAKTGQNARLEAGYIYMGEGSAAAPEVGDMRISYSALKSDVYVTVFGKLKDTKIIPFLYKGEHKLYRAFAAEREEAIAQLHTEFKTVGWVLRIVGFLMMWFGLTTFFAPISAVLDVLPFLGTVGRGVVGFIMFFVALILSGVTIILSMIFHNIVALILFVLAIGGLIAFMVIRKKKQAEAA